MTIDEDRREAKANPQKQSRQSVRPSDIEETGHDKQAPLGNSSKVPSKPVLDLMFGRSEAPQEKISRAVQHFLSYGIWQHAGNLYGSGHS
jgi:hypothetical protein